MGFKERGKRIQLMARPRAAFAGWPTDDRGRPAWVQVLADADGDCMGWSLTPGRDGTVPLSRLSRLQADFAELYDDDDGIVFDYRHVEV